MPNSVYLYLYLCCMVWLSCQSYGVHVQCTCTVCLHCTALSCIYGMYCLVFMGCIVLYLWDALSCIYGMYCPVCSFLQQYSISVSVFIGLQGIARQLYYSGCLYVSISFKFCLSVCQFVLYLLSICQFALYCTWCLSICNIQ